MKTAVIVLGHGSKSNEANDSMRGIVADVARAGIAEIVDYAFLQHATPTPQEVVARCIRQQVSRIVIVPLFIQPGAHVAKDIPSLVNMMKHQYPEVDIIVAGYAGSHPLIATIVADLAKTCL